MTLHWLLILGLTIICAAFFRYLIADQTQLQNQCRQVLLHSQSQIGKTVERLFRLNGRAEKLIMSHNQALKLLALGTTTSNPVMIADAERKLLVVQTQQRILSGEQTLLLNQIQTMDQPGHLSRTEFATRPPTATAPIYSALDSAHFFRRSMENKLARPVWRSLSSVFLFSDISNLSARCASRLKSEALRWKSILTEVSR